MSAGHWRGRILPAAPGSRVNRLELFYDLVFVLAFLNVTTLVSVNLSVRTLLAGLLVLALLWWCWVSFAALGNAVRTDQGVLPLIGAVTVVALFVLNVSLPEAFASRPGGPPGPLIFAACYLVVRAVQVLVLLTRADAPGRAVLRFGLPLLASVTLLLVAGALPHPPGVGPTWWQLALWAAAVGVEFTAGGRVRSVRLTVVSAGHWAERYALILLIALGESIISLGLGPKPATGSSLSWAVIVASILGVTTIAALWWMYFDTVAHAIEQQLHGTRDPDARAAYARDVYAYLHLPLIAGIILFALGAKRYLAVIADPHGDPWRVRALGVDYRVLFSGVIIYIVGLLALWARATHRVRLWPAVTVVALIAVLLPAGRLPAVAGLAVLALASVALVLTGLRAGDPLRRRVRQTALDEQIAAEQEQSEWRRRHL
ncbi:low temperature requirement protein A [Micromonospora narathiwatensis]|uniref:Low temperature requirement protein LtrA n=1 Tax=Micromonospora narathiwatensis TaxID=299146 RepID=A0A1A8ZP00_9ACTN|nr:low temperature requirement protein A [Micromonospora narathiwatensis]SBT45616.1 Low temperature requirement protein LtrA [Micromonospora narathiwatensis]